MGERVKAMIAETFMPDISASESFSCHVDAMLPVT